MCRCRFCSLVLRILCPRGRPRWATTARGYCATGPVASWAMVMAQRPTPHRNSKTNKNNIVLYVYVAQSACNFPYNNMCNNISAVFLVALLVVEEIFRKFLRFWCAYAPSRLGCEATVSQRPSPVRSVQPGVLKCACWLLYRLKHVLMMNQRKCQHQGLVLTGGYLGPRCA
jgi:hypothetical protein